MSESLVRNSASLCTWPGPNATSTNGKRANTSSLTDCAQQPPTPTITLGTLGLQPLGLAEVGDEPAVGLLADRAGVEQDQVGLVARRRLGVPERLEHPLHALGVVLVHLAAERRDVVALHCGKGTEAAPWHPAAPIDQMRGSPGRPGRQNVNTTARTSATSPTTKRIVPAVWMSIQLTWAVTAHFRIAPTAIKRIAAPIVTRPRLLARFHDGGRAKPARSRGETAPT